MPTRPGRSGRSGRSAFALALLLVAAGCTPGPAAPATTVPASSTTGPGPSVAAPPAATTAAWPDSSPGTAFRSGGATRSGTAPSGAPSGTAPSSTVLPGSTIAPAPGGSGGNCVAGRCYDVGTVHDLPRGVAPESSGIAASSTTPGAYYLVDDGTGTDGIVAVRSDGSLIARIPVAGMSARNAEALAAGPCGSRAGRCLYIGDIGDNAAARASITVYRVSEPALSSAPRAPLPADAWRYTYPDGPHNAEALVVGPDGALLVLTKSAPDPTTGQVPPHRIYRAPAGGGALVFVSSYRPPSPALPAQSLFTGTVVTDAAFSAGRLLLLTYDEVVEYRAPTPDADPATFPSWPHAELPAPAMIQSEGITTQLTGCGYEVTSEQGPNGDRAALAGVTCR